MTTYKTFNIYDRVKRLGEPSDWDIGTVTDIGPEGYDVLFDSTGPYSGMRGEELDLVFRPSEAKDAPKRSLRILVDMDGVIADWGKEWDRALGDANPAIPRHKQQTTFNLKAGLGEADCQRIDEIMATPGFYAALEPIDGAKAALKRLVKEGHDVRIVTSPWASNPTCASDKLNWVVKHYGSHWAKRVIITSDKTFVDGDILIDDKPEVTGDNPNPSWLHVIFSQPYNQHVDKPRLPQWTDVDVAGTLEKMLASQRTSDKFVKGSEVRSVSSTGGEKGVKDARFDLIPIGALTSLANHYGAGAKKYADNQWRKGYEWSKSYAALQRHATQFWNGEDFDAETGSNHMAAVAWHAFTLLTFFEDYPQFDDRFRKERTV